MLLCLLSLCLLVSVAGEPSPASAEFTSGRARDAAVLAYLFDQIPGSKLDLDSGIVTVAFSKLTFLPAGFTPANLSVQLVWNGRIYSGIEFLEKDGNLLLRGYELESLEPNEQNASDLKYRVGMKDSISREFFEFYRSDIMKIAFDKLNPPDLTKE